MPVQRMEIEITCGDNYSRMIDLISPSGAGMVGEILDGVLSFEDNSAQLVLLQKGTGTAAGKRGQKWTAGSYLGVGGPGQNSSLGAGVQLDEIWVRNVTPGSNAFIAFNGSIRTPG